MSGLILPSGPQDGVIWQAGMDFVNARGRPFLGTFTRASSAWMGGVAYGVDVPRTVDYAGGKLVLLEGVRTNLCLTSGFQTDGNADGVADNWLVYSADTGQSRTLTRTALPDGTFAQRYTITGHATSSNSILNSVAVAVTAGTTYTVSADIAANNGLVYLAFRWLDASNATISDASSSAFAATATRVKRTLTATAPANATKVQIFIRGIQSAGQWMEAAHVQLEAAPSATSYIPTTTAAVTRAVETWQFNALAERVSSGKPFTIKVANYRPFASASYGPEVNFTGGVNGSNILYVTRNNTANGTPLLNVRRDGAASQYPTLGAAYGVGVGAWQISTVVSDGSKITLYSGAGSASTTTIPNGLTSARIRASQSDFFGFGAPNLAIPFIRPWALSASEIAAEDARWSVALNATTLPTL